MRSEENKRGTATVSEKFWGKCTVQGVPGLDPSTNTSPNPVAQVPPLLTKDRAQTNKRQTFIARRGRTARASGRGPWPPGARGNSHILRMGLGWLGPRARARAPRSLGLGRSAAGARPRSLGLGRSASAHRPRSLGLGASALVARARRIGRSALVARPRSLGPRALLLVARA